MSPPLILLLPILPQFLLCHQFHIERCHQSHARAVALVPHTRRGFYFGLEDGALVGRERHEIEFYFRGLILFDTCLDGRSGHGQPRKVVRCVCAVGVGGVGSDGDGAWLEPVEFVDCAIMVWD